MDFSNFILLKIYQRTYKTPSEKSGDVSSISFPARNVNFQKLIRPLAYPDGDDDCIFQEI